MKIKTILLAAIAALALVNPVSAAQLHPADTGNAAKALDLAKHLNVCSTTCKVVVYKSEIIIAKQKDFSDWQDCYISSEFYNSFYVELAGCGGAE